MINVVYLALAWQIINFTINSKYFEDFTVQKYVNFDAGASTAGWRANINARVRRISIMNQ